MLLPGFVQLQARRLTNLPCLGNSMHMGNVGRKLGIYRWQMNTTQLIWPAVGSPNAVLQPCRRLHPDAAVVLHVPVSRLTSAYFSKCSLL